MREVGPIAPKARGQRARSGTAIAAVVSVIALFVLCSQSPKHMNFSAKIWRSTPQQEHAADHGYDMKKINIGRHIALADQQKELKWACGGEFPINWQVYLPSNCVLSTR
eukprot:SAG31_NODE_1244_length_9137_cov_36.820978_2_plen_109_part_00